MIKEINMNDENNSKTLAQDSEFHIALGWIAALSVSIASWAGLS
jgi:hypothetical protein